VNQFKSIVKKIFLNYPTDYNGSFGGDRPTYQAFKELLVKFSFGQGMRYPITMVLGP
jgi:hypothetical protein